MSDKDTIYRQAAIDAMFSEPLYEPGMKKRAADVVVPAIYEKIKSLPSAQPEQRWIPLAERLPEDGTWNIFTDGETISVERYKMDAIDHFFPQGRWFSLDEAIAWMSLPEPYRGEKSNLD